MQNVLYTQENFLWTDYFSFPCQLSCANNGLKIKEMFEPEENLPVCKRGLIANVLYRPSLVTTNFNIQHPKLGKPFRYLQSL